MLCQNYSYEKNISLLDSINVRSDCIFLLTDIDLHCPQNVCELFLVALGFSSNSFWQTHYLLSTTIWAFRAFWIGFFIFQTFDRSFDFLQYRIWSWSKLSGTWTKNGKDSGQVGKMESLQNLKQAAWSLNV